jgi:putative membrane protein
MMAGYGAWGFGWILWLFVFGAALWAVVAAIRPGRREDLARRILDERLARGELSLEEYRKLRAEL